MSEKIMLLRTGIAITERCNLNCKLCAEFSPYYNPCYHASFKEVKRAIDIYFMIVDHVGDLSFYGGEPLLNKCLFDILQYTSEKYIDRIDRLLVLTNGTILPDKEKLIKLMSVDKVKKKFQINISDYGLNLSKKVSEIINLCKKMNINYRVIKYFGIDAFCDGWVDFGNFERIYINEKDIIEHARKCTYWRNVYTCIHFENDRVYFSRCGRAYWNFHLGNKINLENDIIVFPADVNSESIEITTKKILALLSADYSGTCAYCNGMCEDSPRFVPAEQLKQKI